jgi:hypothetical protein
LNRSEASPRIAYSRAQESLAQPALDSTNLPEFADAAILLLR